MKTALIALAAMFATAAIVPSAQADVTRTTVGPRGDSVTVTRQAEPGGATIARETSTGRSAERVVTRGLDAETGQGSRTVTGQTGSGATWTSDGTLLCEGGVCTRSRTVVTEDGRTATATGAAILQRGGVDRTVTRTGPAGRSATTARSWRRIGN